MGLKGILSLLKEGGGFLKDYVKKRYVPAALQTTRTDEGLEYLAKHHKLQQESLQHLRKQLEARGKRLSREAQDIIDSISGPKSASGSIAKPGATQREMNKIAQQVRELDKEKNILDDILSRGLEGLDADGIAAYEYQREKVTGLLKGLLVAASSTGGGVYLGGKAAGGQRYPGDLFKDWEGQRYRLHKIEEKQEPEAALQQMEEETQIGPVKGYFKGLGFGEEEGTWGEPAGKLLMDIISPIPRQD